MDEWETIARPGYFGSKRDEKIEGFNAEYGAGNWRIAWEFNGKTIDFPLACQVYEMGYYHDSFNREKLWWDLSQAASEVYDHTPSNIDSGLDYMIQEGEATHLQDIAIRRVMWLRGWKFEGSEPVQIRSHSDPWGAALSPGRVPFHMYRMIKSPRIGGWWDKDSVEDFYQSNKVLQIRTF